MRSLCKVVKDSIKVGSGVQSFIDSKEKGTKVGFKLGNIKR